MARMTEAEANRRFKRKIKRDIEKDLRAKERAQLGELRARIRRLRAERRGETRRAKALCRAQRRRIVSVRRAALAQIRAERERLKRLRARVLSRARSAQERARRLCRARGARAQQARAAALQVAERELREAQALHDQMVALDRRQRQQSPRVSFREKRQESDDAVRQNLPDDLIPIFDRVRRHIKATPGKSRTEAFLQWAEENPDEIVMLRQEQADRELAKLLREEGRQARRLRKGEYRRELETELAAVPF